MKHTRKRGAVSNRYQKQEIAGLESTIQGGWWEGSGLGTHVHLWWLHINVWQNQYSIVK